ncbi:NERD domain-containing protein [Desulfopila sp. IMCC35006]|uniref:nuclease-related domain-containing protein n=1 Tax=Desulfopila sp. IMCC35006 TaxID=2569542 RepID=UPI0010AC47C0|nr:NERD domain-containing protein [Desulfopila sp. IMCC35006]TKB25147.1 NERD domain-containing protein [Desulfopila sp. IMCC35006]
MKGFFGELIVSFFGWLFLDKDIYKKINNITVWENGSSTQVDHILVSMYGIFVVETKNYSGWIYGHQDQANWTQVIYGKKYSFQNPLKQNYRHIKILSDFLNLDTDKFHSVIMFIGESKFKTPMPANVLDRGYTAHIISKRSFLLHTEQVEQCFRKLKQYKERSSYDDRSNHIYSLKQRHNSVTNCPKCGAKLVKRTAKRGKNCGEQFLGCSGYPRCKFTRHLTNN